MNEKELREASTCAACGKPIGHAGLPMFWRVRFQRFGVDLNAVRRQDGLATFLGNATLAAALSPERDLASPIDAPIEVTVCETCASVPHSVYELALGGH